MSTPDPTPALIEYPCDFPIKVMGVNSEDFVQAMVAIAQELAPGFDPATLARRPSKAGNYLGLTVTVRVHSREQLDSIYRRITSHPLAKYTL